MVEGGVGDGEHGGLRGKISKKKKLKVERNECGHLSLGPSIFNHGLFPSAGWFTFEVLKFEVLRLEDSEESNLLFQNKTKNKNNHI